METGRFRYVDYEFKKFPPQRPAVNWQFNAKVEHFRCLSRVIGFFDFENIEEIYFAER